MRYGMVVDLDRCIGCKTCAVICKDHNAQPQGIWWNRVNTVGADQFSQAHISKGGEISLYFLPVACQHCQDAPCATVCPTGATYIDPENQTVLVDYENCIGCRYCMTACPYGVRQLNLSKERGVPGTDGTTYHYGYPEDYRRDGHLVYTPERPEGVVEKCTMCAQYTSQGLDPMCCTGCPGNARIFGDWDDPESALSTYVAAAKEEGRATFVLAPEYNTNPSVVYLARRKPREEVMQ